MRLTIRPYGKRPRDKWEGAYSVPRVFDNHAERYCAGVAHSARTFFGDHRDAGVALAECTNLVRKG